MFSILVVYFVYTKFLAQRYYIALFQHLAFCRHSLGVMCAKTNTGNDCGWRKTFVIGMGKRDGHEY